MPEQTSEASSQHAVAADRIFDGYRWHERAAVLVKGGRIQGIAASGDIPDDWPQRRLPNGTIVAPGFIDLQVNGGGGRLLNDSPTADTMHAIAQVHRRFGTTACLPTMITDTREQMQCAIAAALKAGNGDGVLGVHLEGKAPLFEVAQAGDSAGPFLGLRQGRKEQRRQDGDDGDDHQQFDECKCPSGISAFSGTDIRLAVHAFPKS